MKKLLFVFLLGMGFALSSCDKSDDVVKLVGEDEISITDVATVVNTEVAIADVMTEVDYESDMFFLTESSTKSRGSGSVRRNYGDLYKKWNCYNNDEDQK